MRLRIYRSDKGDCLLLTGTAGGNILVDGGMRQAFVDHVRPDLGRLARNKEALDLVYVSHIDQDHISGVLELLNNVMAWRVYDFRKREGARVKQPAFARMPEIKEIWHNAFSELLSENAAPIERLLAQSSLVLGLSSLPELQTGACKHHELAYSMKEAMQVSHRVSASQLNIPLNSQFDGKLIIARSPARRAARIEKMDLFVLGPLPSELDRVRKDWNAWLRKEKDTIRKLKREAEADARSIGSSADRIADLLAVRVDELGKRASVTAPNLASVMLLVREGKTKVLLTGDGHSQDILSGLKHHKEFDVRGNFHVNALKVPHHGSHHNYDGEMAAKVTADHYVFCGNGKDDNPETTVVALICEAHRAARPNSAFTLWFNCTPEQAPAGKPRSNMQKVRKEIERQIRAAGRNQIKAKFLDRSFFDLNL